MAKDSAEDAGRGEDAALLERFMLPGRLERLDGVLERRTGSLTVVLDNVRNYHNISAVLRSADAFGLTEVHLVGSGFEFSPSISLGSERWMQLCRHAQPEEALAALKERNFRLAVLQPEELCRQEPHVPSLPVTALPFEDRLALVFGNEQLGVSAALAGAADLHAYIPMCGFVESLNISVACAISLFCSTIRAEPERRCQPLDEQERAAIRSDWLKKSVHRSEVILREAKLRAAAEEKSSSGGEEM